MEICVDISDISGDVLDGGGCVLGGGGVVIGAGGCVVCNAVFNDGCDVTFDEFTGSFSGASLPGGIMG